MQTDFEALDLDPTSEDILMANFHASVSCLSRSKGHSAVAAAAYRSGQRAIDHRTGVVHDFTRRKVVSFSRVFVPQGLEARDRFEYWNHAEAAERRKNSTVARDLVLSLPFELPHPAKIDLVTSMAEWVSGRYQCVVDAVLHDPSHANDPRNYHAHLLMSTRRISASGFQEKCRELDSLKTGRKEILAIREKWCEIVNQSLENNGFAVRVDHRSHRDRGLSTLPTIRHGRGPDARSRKAHNRAVQNINRQLAENVNESSQLPTHNNVPDQMQESDKRQYIYARERQS